MISIFMLIKRQIQREYLVYMRQKKSWLNALIFFILILIFFPLTMPSDARLLHLIGPGVIWIAVLLSGLLSAERLFQSDYDDGVIEIWLASGYPISALVLAKIVMHWMVSIIPILILSPILSMLFGFGRHDTVVLLLSLLFGTPAIVMLCSFAAAFSTSLQQKGLLMGLILLPLTIPVMILGSITMTTSMNSMPANGYLAYLLALSCLTITMLPFAIASVIKAGMTD